MWHDTMAPMNLRMLLFGALALFPFVPGVVGQSSVSVTTQPMQEPPGWASQNALQLSLTLHPGGTLPSQFTVIPLTTSVGLNGTGTEKAVGSSLRLLPLQRARNKCS